MNRTEAFEWLVWLDSLSKPHQRMVRLTVRVFEAQGNTLVRACILARAIYNAAVSARDN